MYPHRLERPECALAYPVFPISKGLTSRVIAEGRMVNIGNVADEPDYLKALGDTRSEVIVPVVDKKRHRVIGTIDVESERLDAFDVAKARDRRMRTHTKAFLETAIRPFKSVGGDFKQPMDRN